MTRPRYSARDREQAALVCAAMASTDLPNNWRNMTNSDLRATLGCSEAVIGLASSAWFHVADSLGWPRPIDSPVLDAEAESLLRSGWMP